MRCDGEREGESNVLAAFVQPILAPLAGCAAGFSTCVSSVTVRTGVSARIRKP